MPVLFAANEPEAFDANYTITTSSSDVRSGYATAAIFIAAGSQRIGFDIAPSTQFYVQFYGMIQSNPSITPSTLFRLGTALDSGPYRVSKVSNAEKFVFTNSDGSTVYATSADTYSTVASQTTFFIKTGAEGIFRIWQSGTLKLEYLGDLSELTEISYVTLGAIAATSYPTKVSEVIAHTSPPFDMGVKTLRPNAAGTHSDWSGVYTSIDDSGAANTTDFVSAATGGLRSTFNLTNLNVDTLHVKNVNVYASASRGATGPQGLKLGLITNSTTVDGDTSVLGESATSVSMSMNLNPVTGVNWTREELDALQIGVLSVD